MKEYKNVKPIIRELDYMHGDTLVTKIYVDFKEEKIRIENYSDDLIDRAFGCIEEPTWEDFEMFLEERCFPRTRDKMKSILRDIGVDTYDPWQIIQVTEGRMAEDRHWIQIVK